MGDEPKGLGQSLDDLIRENQQKRERRAIAPKPQGGVNKARSNTAPKVSDKVMAEAAGSLRAGSVDKREM